MINRFIFGHGVVIYFIMQSLFEKISKDSPCFHSKRGNPTSAILFILTVAAAIIPHTKSDGIAAMAMHPVLKPNFFRISICLRIAQNNRAKLHHTLQYRPIRKQSVHWVPAGLVYVMLSNSGIQYNVYNVIFVDVISALNRVALNQSENGIYLVS